MTILKWLFPTLFSEECNEGYVMTVSFHVKDGSSYHNRLDEALEDSIRVFEKDMQIKISDLTLGKGKILPIGELIFFNLFIFLIVGSISSVSFLFLNWIS